ncbi:MAG: hypothetical protein D6715_05050 [Calditrichaeota bacterium]|nr:MAG: hypothetical protein D6715_05050 [Calditrichota bacterium]
MLEVYLENQVVINIIGLSLILAVIVGIWWGRKSVRAPFVERRLERRTLWKRLRWRFSRHKMAPRFGR